MIEQLVPTERIKLLNVGNKNEKEKLNVNNNLSTINQSQIITTPIETNPSILYSSLTPELQFFKKIKKCTYYEYGSYPVYQKIYYCEICDPNNTEKICNECFTRCHGSCGNENQDDDSEQENNNLLIIDEDLKKHDEFASFICECGRKLHVLNKKIETTKGSMCMFLELDYKLHNKATYSCETCNVKTLCYICYLKCHGSKYNCVTKKKLTTDPFANKNKVCLCTHENHSSRIILNKFMNNIFQGKSNYDTIPFVWKSQILNCAFDGSIYQTLYEKVYTYILSFHSATFDENGIDDIAIDTLSRFVINISKTKKFYYLHDNLIRVIPMNKLIMLINSFQNNHLVDYSIFISGLLNLFLVLHLKKDFQGMKSMCYKDFLMTNSIDRLNMKLFIFTNTIYTCDIIKKYTVEKGKTFKYILPKICINLVKLLIRAIGEYDDKSYDKFISSYMVILKIVYFCIKRFLFSKKHLLKLIDVMEKFCVIFNGVIKKLISASMTQKNKKTSNEINFSNRTFNGNNNNNNDNNKSLLFSSSSSLSLLWNMLNYISKITHVIIVSYNDIVVSELLENNITKDNIDNEDNSKFIHYLTTQSKKVFKIMTSTSLLFNTFLLNDITTANKSNSKTIAFYFDVINFVNQSLEMFTLSDNIYYKRLCDVTLEDFNCYERTKKIIERRGKYEEDLKLQHSKKKNFENEDITNVIDKDEYDTIEISDEDKDTNLNKAMMITTFNTQRQLESLLNLFFHAKIDYDHLDDKFHDVIFSFGKNWNFCDLNVDNLFIKSAKRKKSFFWGNYDTIELSATIKEKSNTMISNNEDINVTHDKLKVKALHNFYAEISMMTKEIFAMINDEVIFNEEKRNAIVDELIFSVIDNTLTKLFIIDPVMKRYSERTIDVIFTFLLFFCLNKSGLLHFLTGRNLGRIISIFETFPKMTLRFVAMIAKGVDLFDIDISQHKQIPVLLNVIYKFIKENIDEDDVDSNKNDIRDCIVQTMEILFHLSNNFEIESLTKINLLIVEQIEKLISKKKIQRMFPFERLVEKKKNKIVNEEEEEDDDVFNTEIDKDIKFIIKEDNSYELAFIRDMFIKAKGIDNKFPSKKSSFTRAIYRIEMVDTFIDAKNPNIAIEINNKDDENDSLPQNTPDESLPNINNSYSNATILTQFPFENKKLIAEQKFFFSLIKLLSNITYFFIMKNNTFSTFQSINDLDFYKRLLSENYISLKDRTTLLVYIRMVYINDQIDENSSLILQKYMNSMEYAEALKDLRMLTNDPRATTLTIPIEFFERLNDKAKEAAYERLKAMNAFDRFDNIANLKNVIEIFIHELKNIFFYIYTESDEEIETINEYITQIIYSIKIISDVFITYEISSHMSLWFYEMTKEFLSKVEFFVNYFTTIDTQLSMGGISLSSNAMSRLVGEMEKKNFDIYDTEKIYGFILEGYQYFYDNTNFNKNFKLSTFISNYVNNDERNFKNFTLNKMEIPFYSFAMHQSKYNPSTKENISNNNANIQSSSYNTFKQISSVYLHQFNNFFKTSFYDLICCSSYEMTLNYNEIFLNYCVVYIYNIKSLPSESMVPFLTMLDKLLIYEPLETQKALTKIFMRKNKLIDSTTNRKSSYEEKFFGNLSSLLQEKININIATCKNIVIYKRYEKINTATKILIQFFQLLGEGHNKDFHNLIIAGQISGNSNQNNQKITSIFQVLVNSLGHIINCFDSYQNLIMKGELPFDKLIVMTKNIIDFIIEYFQGTTIEKYKIMYEALKVIFPQIKSFIFYTTKVNDDDNEEQSSLSSSLYNEKRNVIYSIKINLLELISSLIEEGNADNQNLNTLTNIIENFSPVDLYEDVVNSFEHIVTSTPSLTSKSLESESIIDSLIELYKYDDDFQNSIDLKWALKIYYYMRVLSDVYDRGEVKTFLDNFKVIYDNANSTQNASNTSTSIAVSVTKQTLPKGIKISHEKANYVVYLFLHKLLTRIEIKETDNESNKDFSFFVIPPICFLLSNHTIMFFNKYVDRDSVHSKIISLINETDYFIYEMFYNNHNFRSYSKLSKLLSSMNISAAEKFNYFLIILHNLFVLVHFYSINEIDPNKKNDINIYNFILSWVHIAFIIVVLFIWFYYIFRLEYIHNIMKERGIKFIFRQSDDKNSHFTTLSESTENLLKKVEKQIPLSDKLSLFFLDSILLNRQINMILATLICVIVYLCTGSSIALAIPILFLANMNELLYGIILTVKLRWSQLLVVLTYSYLIVYLFAILAFYYFTESFNFDDVYDVENDRIIPEGELMCSSVVQCYLTLLNYGVRSGGGIADVIIKLAYNPSVGSYVARFFFDILFHIIIILIMTNLIFGIIVDSFADLRNKNNELIYDKSNVCFICQMTRDSAMNKNIDFDMHRATVHNLWNYVYFLTYLHINNQNNFKMLETAVWNKIHKMDTSWIPTSEKDDDKGSGKEEDDVFVGDFGNDMKIAFMLRDEDTDAKRMKEIMMNVAMSIMKSSIKRNDEGVNKRKILMWIEQGCKKVVNYVKEWERWKEIVEKCEGEKVNYVKVTDEIDTNGKQIMTMLVIGPDDAKIIDRIIKK